MMDSKGLTQVQQRSGRDSSTDTITNLHWNLSVKKLHLICLLSVH